MKGLDIQIELKNYKIRDGFLFKRSRIMRQWRKRWIVVTINFLFSFQTEKCEKPTQIIDLKQVLSLRTMLKKSEDTYTNCLYIQTKTTDFALATNEANQKWSWIVTFERLMDFKERGASHYNNIDQIKTQGFESQDEFQFKQKINIKNSPKVAKTISFHQQEKKKEMMADQILRKLLQQQEIMNKRQQSLLILQKNIQKDYKMNLQYKLRSEQLNNRVEQLQQELKQIRNPRIDQNNKRLISQQKRTKDQNLSAYQHYQQIQTINSSTPIESMQLGRQQIICNLFEEFYAIQSREQLSIILEFFLKISQKQSNKYSWLLQKQFSIHKLADNCILSFFELVEKANFQDENQIYRVIVMMNLIFKSNKSRQQLFYQSAREIVLKLCSSFTKLTRCDLLKGTIQLLILLLDKCRSKNPQQTIKIVIGLIQLSSDSQFKENCNLILSKLKE